jgi:hypothetical protein
MTLLINNLYENKTVILLNILDLKLEKYFYFLYTIYDREVFRADVSRDFG